MFGSKNFWEPIGSHFLRTEFLSKTEELNRNRTENRMPTPKSAYSVWLALGPLKTMSWPWRFPWGRRRFAAGTVPEPRPPSTSRRGAPAGSPRRRAAAPSAHRRRGQRWA